MDLNKIDKIVSDYVKDESNKKAISTLDTVIPMCERVLTEKLDVMRQINGQEILM